MEQTDLSELIKNFILDSSEQKCKHNFNELIKYFSNSNESRIAYQNTEFNSRFNWSFKIPNSKKVKIDYNCLHECPCKNKLTKLNNEITKELYLNNKHFISFSFEPDIDDTLYIRCMVWDKFWHGEFRNSACSETVYHLPRVTYTESYFPSFTYGSIGILNSNSIFTLELTDTEYEQIIKGADKSILNCPTKDTRRWWTLMSKEFNIKRKLAPKTIKKITDNLVISGILKVDFNI
jgi:putative sterol carrier protein